MGADESVVKVMGVKTVVGFVTDAESGQIVGMDVLVKQDVEGFAEWLGGYVSELGVEALVSDALPTYKPVVERLGLEHQVCVAHVRKNVRRRLHEIEGWEWHKAQIWRLLMELDDDDSLDLDALTRNIERWLDTPLSGFVLTTANG